MTTELLPAVTAVSVTVDPDTGDITCLPNPVPVIRGKGLISFNLVTPGFAFRPSNAVVVDEPNHDFPFPSWTVTAVLATVLDLNTVKETFEYSVYVFDTASGKQFSVDPVINNGGTTNND